MLLPKKVVDKEKNGVRIFDIKINKNITAVSDSSESVIGMKDLKSSVEMKKAVR